MDGQSCDRHSSARAAARVILANLGTLYLCGHCCKAFSANYHGDFNIQYEAVTV